MTHGCIDNMRLSMQTMGLNLRLTSRSGYAQENPDLDEQPDRAPEGMELEEDARR